MLSLNAKLIGATVAAVIAASVATAQDISELQRDLRVVTGEIAAAERVVTSREPEDVREIARMRLEVMRLSKALLEYRINVIRSGQESVIVPQAVQPDPSVAGEIERAIRDAENRSAQATRDADLEIGDLREAALTRAETEKLTAAQLRLAHYQAAYGFYIPASFDDPEAAWESAAATAPVTYAWSDRRYPQIDYSHPLFQRAYQEGAQIAGWWTMAATETNVFANNLSYYSAARDPSRLDAQLHVQCFDGVTSVAFVLSGYLSGNLGSASARSSFAVNYRIDGGPRVSDTWSSAVAGQGASLDGAPAEQLIERLGRARTFQIELTDSGRTRHEAVFDLAGIEDVAFEVERTCVASQAARPTPLPPLTRDDYRKIQQALNVAGYSAGIEDGIWGARSNTALRNYQSSAGLSSTGSPDRETLLLLGLID